MRLSENSTASVADKEEKVPYPAPATEKEKESNASARDRAWVTPTLSVVGILIPIAFGAAQATGIVHISTGLSMVVAPIFTVLFGAMIVVFTYLIAHEWREERGGRFVEVCGGLILFLGMMILPVEVFTFDLWTRMMEAYSPSTAFLAFSGIGVVSFLVGRFATLWLCPLLISKGATQRFATGAGALFPYLNHNSLPLRASVQIETPHCGVGNGFLVDAGGLVLTASHVVSDDIGNTDICYVRLANGEVYAGQVIARKPEWDCALVQINVPYRLPIARVGPGRYLRVGNELLLMGWHPKTSSTLPRRKSDLISWFFQPCVIPLRLSAVGVPNEKEGESAFSDLVLTGGASAVPGFSGSAICRPRTGAVLGMECWGETGTDCVRAVPADLLRRFLRESGARTQAHPLWQMPLSQPISGSGRAVAYEHAQALSVLRHAAYGVAPDQAADFLPIVEHAVMSLPEHASGWCSLSALLQTNGRLPDALDTLEHAFALARPSSIASLKAHRLKVDILTAQGDWERAAQSAIAWYSDLPNLEGLSVDHATCYIADLRRIVEVLYQGAQADARWRDDAIDICEDTRAVSNHYLSSPSVVEARQAILVWQGYLYEHSGQAQDALDVFLDVANMNEGRYAWNIHDINAAIGQMRTLLALGGLERCQEALRIGTVLPGKFSKIPPGFYNLMAQAYRGAGSEAEAHTAERYELLLYPGSFSS